MAIARTRAGAHLFILYVYVSALVGVLGKNRAWDLGKGVAGPFSAIIYKTGKAISSVHIFFSIFH